MQEIKLFSRKFYTIGTNFTRLPVVTVATNLNSASTFPLVLNAITLILAPWSQINVIIWLSSNGLSKSWQCQGHLLTKILLLAVGLPDQVLSDQGVCYTWYAASLYQFAQPMDTLCTVNV